MRRWRKPPLCDDVTDLEARWRNAKAKAATQGIARGFLQGGNRTLRRNKSTNNIWGSGAATSRITRAVGPSSPTLRGAASRLASSCRARARLREGRCLVLRWDGYQVERR